MSLRVYTWKVGMSVLYRGVGPTLVGIHPYAVLKFYIYEELNRRVLEEHQNSVMLCLSCGDLTGLFGQTFTYPLNVVRRRCGFRVCNKQGIFSPSDIEVCFDNFSYYRSLQPHFLFLGRSSCNGFWARISLEGDAIVSMKPKRTNLSKYLVTLLSYGGVPEEYFLGQTHSIKSVSMDDFLLANM
ncbi:hypothetical protein MKW98_008193 [Papaver atlanticum]|uniref:Uncharacterized protein n=1 Tax=Papaver atlanticum TaxID=357466 RepID=A0AAD4RVW3_9MAGN|nr:hypothetical protein MKW98_008193 [Papaver atlanticum]